MQVPEDDKPSIPASTDLLLSSTGAGWKGEVKARALDKARGVRRISGAHTASAVANFARVH